VKDNGFPWPPPGLLEIFVNLCTIHKADVSHRQNVGFCRIQLPPPPLIVAQSPQSLSQSSWPGDITWQTVNSTPLFPRTAHATSHRQG
jgi:hypothetical protein